MPCSNTCQPVKCRTTHPHPSTAFPHPTCQNWLNTANTWISLLACPHPLVDLGPLFTLWTFSYVSFFIPPPSLLPHFRRTFCAAKAGPLVGGISHYGQCWLGVVGSMRQTGGRRDGGPLYRAAELWITTRLSAAYLARANICCGGTTLIDNGGLERNFLSGALPPPILPHKTYNYLTAAVLGISLSCAVAVWVNGH